MTEYNPLRDGVSSGDLVDGRYEVVDRIGSGGMADVYCAQDRQLGRKIALKVLHRRFAEDEEFVERFRREASAAAGLQHPNVVQVFDRGSWDGTYYIAMEFLEGRSLKQIVREDAPLPATLAIDLTVQILRAARFAHKRGVIHRDIKPHNVIVDPEGRVKVTDFGIARAGASDMTETGAIMGTAAYLSPEQAQGHAVSATSDLYSIGILLFELLTGRVPFEAESAVTIALKQVSEEPLPPRALNPDVSPELEDVVLRALQKDPARRFSDADEFVAALEAVRDYPARPDVVQRSGSLTGSYPAQATDEVLLEEAVRSWRFWATVLLAIIALTAIGVGAYLLLRPDAQPVPDVVGLEQSVAAARVNGDGFAVDIQQQPSPDQPAGRVIRQNPAPGTEVQEGATVTLFVSSGPGQAEVPDVTGQRLGVARRAVKGRGFKPRVIRQFNDDLGAGLVIETRPGAGSAAEIGATVSIVVSRGPEQVVVPDLAGQPRADAEATLTDLGLQPAVQEEESEEAVGTVLAQDPEAGTEVDEGATVTITVAVEPAEVAIPDVTGAPTADARAALRAAGFTAVREFVLVEDPNEDGIVQVQRPGAGRQAPKGTSVTIVIGRFDDSQLDPEGEATPTPTASPTPTPTP